MEKRDCGIVRDLMPLVIDQVASPASTELVESHIRRNAARSWRCCARSLP